MAQAQTINKPLDISQQESEKPRRPFRWYNVFLYAMLLVFTITSLGPFIFTFLSSFKTFSHILDYPPTLLPNPVTYDNFARLISDPDFLRWILNSGIYAVSVAALDVLFSAMAGYALSRIKFRGREVIFLATLAVMMIPAPITIIPKFLIMNSVHLVNTYFALILPVMAQPFAVFLMVQFMKSLPRELEESAMLDGASRWTIFTQVILPLVKPALIAVAIISFQGAWNDFLWPLLVLNSRNMYTLPLGMFFYKSAYYTEYNLLIAGSMFNTIPMFILFFIFQRYFIEGATSAAVKG
ncbi:ABC transporter permease [Ktedonobacter sp. SOSP1-85]|uniref:Binding-protein-dependent transport systems inner membrane component n=1 Tax=Ktedonobacter racemifer DSM 44963 TaxID=485913 RepID=D6TRP2_KTERA|nr:MULTISPECIES: carbohydrate ABC transporter permease [Ktedonobacter]EFH85994.1 binding-protein-dependent transport systems inner membrane component [Ktedonobacter racemifer DSM 44963]GHO76680.1 ABC transporter permease [Ktedonobacter sp. SOSP1-85]